MSSRASLCVLAMLVISVALGGQSSKRVPRDQAETSSNDHYRPFLINNVFNYYSNNGDGSFNPYSIDAEGFEFPKGSGKQLFFEDGLVVVGYQRTRQNDTLGPARLKASGSTYYHGLQAGPIIQSGSASALPTAAYPTDARYRLFRVRPDINPRVSLADVKALLDSGEVALISRFEPCTSQSLYDQYIKDWNEWPADMGAPFVYGKDASGVQRMPPAPYDPKFDIPGEPGADQTLWHVSNDLDVGRSENFYGTDGFGLEIQRTIWGYNIPQSPGRSFYSTALDQTIFIRTLFINKSGLSLDSMYVGQWSDPDIGGASGATKNLFGCDTVLNLGYAYSAGADPAYGILAPAGGFVLLQGPIVPSPGSSAVFRWQQRPGYKNIAMTAVIDGHVPASHYQVVFDLSGPLYHMLKGEAANTGAPQIDPITGMPTTFAYPGDPVTRAGWTQLTTVAPSDVSILMGSGPFSMAPGDTQEVIVANTAGAGSDAISNIAILRVTARTALLAYLVSVNFGPATGIGHAKDQYPVSFALMQNYPNPFNPTTTIRYGLPARAFVTLTVFNTLGQEVATLVRQAEEAGYHEIRFDGSWLASGTYFYRLEAGSFIQTRKMLLLR